MDFFAGPGGLGEGFNAYEVEPGKGAFRLVLSVEKDRAAHKTLQLRAFARQFPRDDLPITYYRYVRGSSTEPYDSTTIDQWRAAELEVLQGALGDPECDARVERRLRQLALRSHPWVLIGGPPCQAYSLVGRARNAGIAAYRPEDDDRHFLYRNYLSVLHKHRPAVFVMENVKGILSSKIAGTQIFHRILADLTDPGRALCSRTGGVRYRIRALSQPAVLESFTDATDLDPRVFVVRSELHGIPQARHRVILIGVRSDVPPRHERLLAPERARISVGKAISDLPRLRSGISGGSDDPECWASCIRDAAERLAPIARLGGLDCVAAELRRIAVSRPPSAFPKHRSSKTAPASTQHPDEFHEWCLDPRLKATLNHESRSHMASDLDRYLFCAAYARALGHSPVARHFPVELAPNHKSWETGAFADRFRVQVEDQVATTITSHISKDGHYFIHPDPMQCRSLTVREAARLQSFPDNYFFMGNRTEQYVQVGNAVPPLLATGLAEIVHTILKGDDETCPPRD